ncbi:MAG TPA: Rrf2 family transcriptional regulator [Candidatus Polarisedimenticolia bacterium]|jgi:Rrf2 family protein|nr:Rrf2 family transcriptional regulator [Candidatus Polarisedimenticolia bacterium]
MQLTKGVEYGIEGILYLARRCDDEPALIREISRATAIPETFLSKIFQRLAMHGIIRSRRGFRGGFRLARPAGRISLREIVEAVQGPIEFHRCLDHLRARGRRHRCHVRRVFRKVQRKVASILEQTTLEDILQATS